MNTNTVPDRVNGKRLTREEIRDLRETGRYYLALDHIPQGCREEAIFAVNQHLYGLRLTQEERLERLADWYFARRPAKNPRDFEQNMGNLRRAVYWEPKWATKEGRKGQFEHLADETIDRLIGYGMLIEDFLRANENKMAAVRKKIEQGLNWLLDCGMPVGRKALERVTGCHKNTVNKHMDIWKTYAEGGAHVYREAKEGSTRARDYDLPPLPETVKTSSDEKKAPSGRGVVTVHREGLLHKDKATIFNEVRNVLRNKSAFINPRISLLRASPLLNTT